MDYTVHGILQARIQEWVAVPLSRESSHPGIKSRSSALQADSLPAELPGQPKGNLERPKWPLRQTHLERAHGVPPGIHLWVQDGAALEPADSTHTGKCMLGSGLTLCSFRLQGEPRRIHVFQYQVLTEKLQSKVNNMKQTYLHTVLGSGTCCGSLVTYLTYLKFCFFWRIYRGNSYLIRFFW